MSVVQPLLVTELVFALVLRRLWIHQQIRDLTWWAAAVTCGALAIFVAVSEPTGGHAPADQFRLDRRHRGHRRGRRDPGPGRHAGLTGAPGGGPGLGHRHPVGACRTYIKAMTDTLTQFGPIGMFTHWPVYALIVVSILAELLDQTALHVGPLSISQPCIVFVDPMVSIVLSVWVFAEVFTENALRLGSASSPSPSCAWRQPCWPARHRRRWSARRALRTPQVPGAAS